MALALISTTVVGAPVRLNLEGRRLQANPDSHHRPLAQSIYISDSEECPAKVASGSSLEIPENCRYLRGLYRYIYQPQDNESRKQIFVGFAVHYGPKGGHALLVNDSVELDETAFQP